MTRAVHEALAPSADLRRERTLRPVTVVFCDIERSTELITRLSPDVAQEILSRIVDTMASTVEAHGGTTLKRLGDGLMAAFGVPVAQPDHALRACAAALDVQAKVAALFDDPSIGPYRSNVRVGINSGEVAFSIEYSNDGAMMLDVTGDQVSLAARVEAAAEPGTVFITDATLRRVRGRVMAEFAGSRPLRGFSSPITLYRLRSVATPVAGLAHFAGRAKELAQVRARLAQLAEEHGGAVFVFGEPGIGKTRFVEEIRHDEIASQFTWLRASSPPLSDNVAFWACGELLREFLGASADAIAGGRITWNALVDALRVVMSDFDGDSGVDEAAALFARILRVETPHPWAERLRAADDDTIYRQTLRSWWRFFAGLASRRPTVLEFDDLQWMDPSSATIVEHVLKLVAERPILLVACGRTAVDGQAGRLVSVARGLLAGRVDEIHLEALDANAAADVLRHSLGVEHTPAALGRLVLERADGNPFFIEEIVRALKQMDLVGQDRLGKLPNEGFDATVKLPESLQEFILARVDRLDERMRDVVRTAAVIGRQFLFRVLKGVTERGLDIDQKVEALERQELIDCLHRFPELEYVFKHAVMQEAIYASVFEQRRRAIHRAVADCIEALFGNDVEGFAAILAYHCLRAEDWPRAERYLFMAADQAQRIAADEDAFRNFEAALELLERRGERDLPPIDMATVRRKLGNIQYRRGDIDAARIQYLNGLAQLGFASPKTALGVRVTIAWQFLLWWSSRVSSTRAAFRGVRSPAEVRELVALFDGLSWTYYHQDQERLLLGLLRGAAVAERGRFLEGIGKGLGALGHVFDIFGRFAIAEHFHVDASAAARSSESGTCVVFTDYMWGLHRYYQGFLQEADQRIEDTQARARRFGDWIAWGSMRTVSAQIALVLGDAPRALAVSGDVLSNAREVALTPAIAWGHMCRGHALHLLGQKDEALRELGDAVTQAQADADHQCTVHSRGVRALVLIASGQLDAAREDCIAAVRMIGKLKLRGHNTVYALQAVAELATQDLEHGPANNRSGLARTARRQLHTALKQASRFRPAMAPVLRVCGTIEWLTGNPEKAIERWRHSATLARDCGARRELAATLREQALRTSDAELLRLSEAVQSTSPGLVPPSK